MSRTLSRLFAALAAAPLVFSGLFTLATPAFVPRASVSAVDADTYQNPLRPTTVIGDGVVESCADPTVIYGQEGEGLWYMYCTTDPLNDTDKTDEGAFRFRLIPMLSSPDLVNWTYRGEAFGSRPSYAVSNAGLWAPEIEYYAETGEYHLYYTVTDTKKKVGGGSAIGVATARTPLGPWTHQQTPVVEPHGADCCGPDSRRWVFDPEVIRTAGPDYIYYGSYFGGISVRVLSEDGLSSNCATSTNVAIANKFEGAEVVQRGGFWHLMASATDCCRGPLTGYSVFVGRSALPTGPFVDRDGQDLNDNEGPDEADPTDARAGGTPVLSMSGNRFVGPGHNTVFEDFDGQWWTIYHAVDRTDPYFAGAVGFTKRPAMLDPLDWDNGWPTVRGGRFGSDSVMPAPAAQPGDNTTYTPSFLPNDAPGAQNAALSDEFNDGTLSSQWSWVRQPAAGSSGEESFAGTDGVFRFDTQSADLFESSNNASVLTQATPNGNYIVEARVRLDVPREGCCFNYTQAGLVIYGNDDNYTKLVHVSIWNTRQTEWAKEVGPVPPGYPRYGNTIDGPPGEWTYLRIARRATAEQPDAYGGDELYTVYTSLDGSNWRRGGTWTHRLGAGAKIGLVSMGGSGFHAQFDYVRVYSLDT